MSCVAKHLAKHRNNAFANAFWWMLIDATDTAAALRNLAFNQGPDARQTKVAYLLWEVLQHQLNIM